MATINPYPTKVAARYKLTSADLRQKGLNLFLIVEREHNYYDDSDTNYLYFDADINSLKTGVWTTRGYCGDCFYDYPPIYTASEDIKTRAMVVLRRWIKGVVTPQSFTEAWWKTTDIENYGIPCVVDGGRKFRGEGLLLKLQKQETYYGNTESVSVWTGEKVGYANPKFIKVDAELVMSKIYAMIDGMDFLQLYEFAKRVFDSDWEKPVITALKMLCPITDCGNAPLEQRRKGLREWVAEKFSDKSQAEQERITHNIMMKKYGEDIEPNDD